MKVRRTYRYRLYPTAVQIASLDEQLGACCDLYNAALEQRTRVWREHDKSVSLYMQMRELTEVRAEGLLPAAMNCEAERSALRRLDRAFQAFFRRSKAGEKPGYPRFRSRLRYDSLTWICDDGAHFDDSRLRLQGIGSVRVRRHRALPGGSEVREITVRRQNGRWYACLECSVPVEDQQPRPSAPIGLDLGVTNHVALSTGELLPGLRLERDQNTALRRAQRKVSRRKRGSNRRRKAAALLARQREREANRRRDHAHKLSRRLADAHSLIAVEDLPVARLTRSGGRFKSGLNRAIADQGWAQFISLLTYKAEEAGGSVVKVDPKYTSQTCAECGHVARESRSGERFACVGCGHIDHADVNAARNILNRALGRSVQALTQDEEVCVA